MNWKQYNNQERKKPIDTYKHKHINVSSPLFPTCSLCLGTHYTNNQFLRQHRLVLHVYQSQQILFLKMNIDFLTLITAGEILYDTKTSTINQYQRS